MLNIQYLVHYEWHVYWSPVAHWLLLDVLKRASRFLLGSIPRFTAYMVNCPQQWAGDLQVEWEGLDWVVDVFNITFLFIPITHHLVNAFLFSEFKNMQQNMDKPKTHVVWKCAILFKCSPVCICLNIGFVSDSIIDETQSETRLVPL